MPKWIAITMTCTLALALAAPAGAVVIFPKGGRAPIKAALVRQDDQKVVYRVVRPDGSTAEREIYRSEIDDMIVTVSAQRLAALRPERPDAYRDYADELVEKREDPDARNMAIRLYLIAAWLDPDRLGRSSLLGMVGLARSAAEERKFRAMAYLLDPQHDQRLLKAPDTTSRVATAATARLPESLLKPLVLLRQGKDRAALMLARRAPAQGQFDQIKDFLSLEEFAAACTMYHRTGQLPPGMLRKILALEMNLGPTATGSGGEPAAAAPAAAWSETVRLGQIGPMPPLTLEDLTDVDPRKCLFRDGQWVEPSAAM